jgi:hypothetical protein
MRSLGALVFLLMAIGCTSRNVPLNTAEVPLADRVGNQTRATSRPTTHSIAGAHTPSDDGCFVGLALSGGG